MDLAMFLPVLLLSVVVHEYAHGWVALRQGDTTALEAGRLTLNPIPHLDLLGSLIFPAILWLTNAPFLFGWAKPVPVNPARFREYRRGDILVSLAGIIANLMLAVAFTLVTVLIIYAARALPGLLPAMTVLERMAFFGILINLILAFFNLIPIPPLDGSHVVYHLLPPRLGARYREVGRYGILVLLAILFFAPDVVRFFLKPVFVLQDVAQNFVRMLI